MTIELQNFSSETSATHSRVQSVKGFTMKLLLRIFLNSVIYKTSHAKQTRPLRYAPGFGYTRLAGIHLHTSYIAKILATYTAIVIHTWFLVGKHNVLVQGWNTAVQLKFGHSSVKITG